ncbi:MAG: glycosyltransferase family 4 protein [Candidatus Parcubacteria bacterium]|nr:glycosyltransferase family 4 protein [Candidatus Parcubacteria bacterium]
MKILMINKFYYRSGGSEIYMLELAKMLKAKGHQLMEFSMQDEKNEASKYQEYFVDNINFNKREGFFKDLKKAFHLIYSCEAKHKLEALIRKEKPDIAHLHNFSFQISPSILGVLKKYKIPVVWTLHDYKVICPNYRLFTRGAVCERCKVHKYYNCFRYRCLKESYATSFLAMLEMYVHKLILKSYQSVALYISPSKFLAEKVKAWGIPAEKVKQLYNFIDLNEWPIADNPGEGLIYVGRLTKEKGIMTLIEAMKALPEIKLQIIGRGPEQENIQQLIHAYNLTNITMLGYKNSQEIKKLLSQSRLMILPSIWYENNPLAVLESFALAKPVIASNLGGLPELIKDGQTGYLFKAGQAADLAAKIKGVYTNNELIKQMGLKARDFVRQSCESNVHCQQIEALYQQVIES